MQKQITLTLEQARAMYGNNTELDLLLEANFTVEELSEPELPKTWDEVRIRREGAISGYFLSEHGNVVDSTGYNTEYDFNNFLTKQHANSALAMAQLSQILDVYNNGWQASWESSIISTSNAKYCIARYCNHIKMTTYYTRHAFLSFKTPEIRDEFYKNFKNLVHQYFMID
jgi:hypothetical protein